MDDLIAFMRARLNEDQAEIEKHPDDAFEIDGFNAGAETGYPGMPILTIGKKRALREVEAKKRIIRAHDAHCGGFCEASYPHAGIDAAHYWSIKVLASAYDDHPDYNERWRP